MDTTILKTHITELLATIKDERFLQSVNAMIQAYVADVSLSQEEKAAIDEGLKDIEEGRTRTHEQVKQNTKNRYPNLWK